MCVFMTLFESRDVCYMQWEVQILNVYLMRYILYIFYNESHSYLVGSAFHSSLFCRLRPASLFTCCCPRWSSPGSLIHWSVHWSWGRISSNGLSWLLTLPSLNFSSWPLQSWCFHCSRDCTFISDLSWISQCWALARHDPFLPSTSAVWRILHWTIASVDWCSGLFQWCWSLVNHS